MEIGAASLSSFRALSSFWLSTEISDLRRLSSAISKGSKYPKVCIRGPKIFIKKRSFWAQNMRPRRFPFKDEAPSSGSERDTHMLTIPEALHGASILPFLYPQLCEMRPAFNSYTGRGRMARRYRASIYTLQNNIVRILSTPQSMGSETPALRTLRIL